MKTKIQNKTNNEREKDLIKKYGTEIAKMTLMDNVFLAGYFQDNPTGISFVLQKILNKENLQAVQVSTEHFIKNLQGRDVRFDVFAVDEVGKQYNIEIQRADSGAVPKRARYHSSMMDCAMLKPKDAFHDLVETVVIFITEHDVMREGKVIYHVNRYVEETGKVFNDEAHIIYVNSQCQDDSPIGKLMHDFNCADPEKMHYPEIAEKAYRLKHEEKEAGNMAGVMEALLEKKEQEVKGVMEALLEKKEQEVKGVMEALLEKKEQEVKGVMEAKQKEMTRDFALALLQDGTFSKEKIAEMTKLELAEVKALAQQL